MTQIAANGTHLEVRIDGPEDGVPILLSNSLASALAMWEHQVAPLVAAGYRVIRYDSRGHGGSGVTEGPYSIELLADDALALLDSLGIERTHFCGLSKGGMVGQWLASHHGDRLHSTTLCDTAAYMGGGQVWQERIDAVRAGGMAAVVDGTVERWFTPAGRERLTDDVAKVREMILATPPEGFCACAGAIMAMDQRESIRAVQVPTLVIVGEDDPGTPVEAAQLIHERIAGSRLVVLPEAAHFANVEQVEGFNAALLQFLQGL
jgi:3-oxoadipate enol-lactonase